MMVHLFSGAAAFLGVSVGVLGVGFVNRPGSVCSRLPRGFGGLPLGLNLSYCDAGSGSVGSSRRWGLRGGVRGVGVVS